jgi:hypothetical protein
MLRQLYEGQSHIDQIVGALGRPNSAEERQATSPS